MVADVNFLYPLLASVGSVLTGSFGLFSPFFRSEAEFKKDANWHLSLLRGKKIDKLKLFVEHTINEKIKEQGDEDSESTNVPYIQDIYEYFIDEIETYQNINNKIFKNLKIYSKFNFTFMLSIILSIITIIVTSIAFKINPILQKYFYELFIIFLIIICLQMVLILVLRHIDSGSDVIYSDRIFKGKNNEFRN